MSGGLISAEYDAQIRGMIRAVQGGNRRRKEMVDAYPVRDAPRFPTLACILDENLAAVTNPLQPTSALARLCKWSVSDAEYVEVEPQITVYNHSFNSYTQHTFGAAIFVDGHHWFFGDCAPMNGELRTDFNPEPSPP